MKHLCEMPTAIVEELTRLHKLETVAWETGQSETAVTCRLRWADLYREANGCASPAPQLLLTVGNTVQGKRLVNKAKWREIKESRPLVAVKKIRLVSWTDKSGAVHYYHVETLACGHTYENMAVDADSPTAKRRRCKQCGSAVMEARQVAAEQTESTQALEVVKWPSSDKFRLA